MLAVRKTQLVADILGITLEELEEMPYDELQLKLINWWQERMITEYDEKEAN